MRESSPRDLLDEASSKIQGALAQIADGGKVEVAAVNEELDEVEIVFGFELENVPFTAMIRLTP